jgi:hypothetical protein
MQLLINSVEVKTFKITVRNETGGKFEAVANKLTAYIPIDSSVNVKDTVEVLDNGRYVFRGFVDSIEKSNDIMLVLTARDFASVLIDKDVPNKTYINKSPEYIIQDLCADGGYPGSLSLMNTGIVFPVFKTSEGSIWENIQNVVKQTAGRLNVLPDGTLYYIAFASSSYTPVVTPEKELNASQLLDIKNEVDSTELINKVNISFAEFEFVDDSIVWKNVTDIEGNGILNDENEVSWDVGLVLAETHKFDGSNITLKHVPVNSIIAVYNDTQETKITDFTIVDASKGIVRINSGASTDDSIRFIYRVDPPLVLQLKFENNTGKNGEVVAVQNPVLSYTVSGTTPTLSLDTEPDKTLYPDADAVLTIDGFDSTTRIHNLEVHATVILKRERKIVDVDETSVQTYGRKEESFEFVGITETLAKKIGDYILKRYANPYKKLTIKIPYDETLQLYDVISVREESWTNTVANFEIVGLDISETTQGKYMTLQLEEYPADWSFGTGTPNTVITKFEQKTILSNNKVAKLLIWYAYPSNINGTYDNQRAGKIFSQYDLVVFPAGLELSTHPDHDNAVEIIKYIKQYSPTTRIFGYIPTGNRGGIDTCYTVDEIYSRAKKWKDLGVHGIFLDEFGFDYGNDRTRQNDILDAVHSLGLIAFVNAWNPDDVFGGTPTIHWLNGIDWYLLESFGSVADGTNWYWVSSADVFYRAWQVKYQYSDFNIKVAGVATANTDEEAETVYKIMYAISTAYGIDAFNVEKAYYYAIDVNLLSIPKLPDYAGNYKGNPEPFAETTNWTLSSGTVLTGCERRYGKSAVGDYDFVWYDATPEPVYIFLSNFFEYDKEKGSLDLFTNTGKIIKAISGNSFTEIDGGKITTGIIKGHYDTTKIDLNNDLIDVANGTVKIGKQVLDDNTDGISINNGKIQIKNSNNSKTLIGADGIRQIYNISLIDQLDSTRGLSIPIYIPQNTDGTGVTNGTARIIVNVEKYRAFSKSALDGGSYSKTQTSQNAVAPWEMLQIETGYGFRTDVAQTILTNSSGGTRTTNTGGSHNHGGSTGTSSAGTVPSGSTGFINGGSPDTDHTHSLVTANTVHTHDISRSGAHTHDVDISHAHTIDVLQINNHKHLVTLYLSNLQHTHDVTISIPAHSHNLQYGIYESTATATVTIKKGTTTIGTVTTGNKGDFANIAVNDGDVISITADNLARVQVYIFVEYYLK